MQKNSVKLMLTKLDFRTCLCSMNKECVIEFNVVYQQFRVMYDSDCQICCKWSRLKPSFNVPAHWSTMPQINILTLGQTNLP